MGSSRRFAGRVIVQQVDGAESADRNNCQCQANACNDESDAAALLLRWGNPRRHTIALPGRKTLLGGRVKGAALVSGLERFRWGTICWISTRHWCTSKALLWITRGIILALIW